MPVERITITNPNHPNFGHVTIINHPDPERPQFKTLTGSEFIAIFGTVLGFARVDELLAKSKTIEALLLKAVTIERLTGNTPTAIAFLKTGANALTDQELAAIDAAWEALT